MNAAQARIEANKTNKVEELFQLDIVYSAIKEASSKGKYEVRINCSKLILTVKEKLAKNDYEIVENHKDGVNEYCTIVKW